jgi:competence protein ComEC
MQSWMMGLVSGIIGGGYWTALPPVFITALLIALAAVTLPLRYRACRFVCGACCGSLLAFVHGTQLLQHRITPECVGIPLTVTGIVNSLPTVRPMPRGEQRQRFEFSVAELTPADCARPRTIMLSYYGDDTIQPGDTWRFEVSLKKPWGLSNPGSFNMQVWFAQQGVDAVGNVRESRHSHRESTLSKGIATSLQSCAP